MGQKLGAFLRVLGSGLSSQAFQANVGMYQQEKAQEAQIAGEQRAEESAIKQMGVKQAFANLGVLSVAAKKANEEGDTEQSHKIGLAAKEIFDKIDPRYRGMAMDSFMTQTMAADKEKEAPKVIKIKEGKDEVAKQWNPKTGKYEEIARGQSAKGTTVNVNSGGSFDKELGKQLGRDFVEKRNDAISAAESLQSSNIAVDLLNKGVITGTGANFILGFGKALKQAGVYDGEALSNTEAYYANQAKQVANIIKAFGAGTGLSDADREYAEKAAAGKITMTEESLRKIIDINARASTNVLNRYNKDAQQVMDKNKDIPFDLMVPIPKFEGAQKKDTLTDEEYEAKKKALGL